MIRYHAADGNPVFRKRRVCRSLLLTLRGSSHRLRPRTRVPPSLFIRFWPGLALLSACSHLPADLSTFSHPPAPSSASLESAEDRAKPRKIILLESPRHLQTESVYPPMMTRQKLVWGGDGMEWHMRFPSRRYAYATFVLKRPIDLASYRNEMRLVFRIRPARLAGFLSIALLDRPTSGAPALSDVWLLDVAPPSGDGWTTVSIPLSAFPAGTLADAMAAESDMAVPAGIHRDLDWSRIQEIRFVSQGGRIPSEDILVRDLRIQRL